MNDDVTGLAFVCGASTVINSIYAIQHGKSPVTNLVAGALIFVALAMFAGLTGRGDVARAFAGLFFVSALIMHGLGLVSTSTGIVSSTETKK